MSLPEHFDEHDPAEVRHPIAEYPLGMLVALGAERLSANHRPCELAAGAGPHGALLTHVARGIGSGRIPPVNRRPW